MNELRSRFEADGVLVLPDFFEQTALAPLNRVIDQLLARPRAVGRPSSQHFVERYATDVQALGDDANDSPAFQEFRQNPKLAELTRALLGEYIDEHLLVHVTHPGNGQAWHQDSRDPEHFVLNRLIYTRDIPAERGQIVVVPGSIHRGRIPPGGHQDSIAGELAIAPRGGTVVLMSSYCWHRVTHNASDQPRVSVNYRVRAQGAPEHLTAVANFRNSAWDFRVESALERAKGNVDQQHESSPASERAKGRSER